MARVCRKVPDRGTVPAVAYIMRGMNVETARATEDATVVGISIIH